MDSQLSKRLVQSHLELWYHFLNVGIVMRLVDLLEGITGSFPSKMRFVCYLGVQTVFVSRLHVSMVSEVTVHEWNFDVVRST